MRRAQCSRSQLAQIRGAARTAGQILDLQPVAELIDEDKAGANCRDTQRRPGVQPNMMIGEYGDIFLFVTLFKSGCGTSGTGGVDSLELYWDPGSDTVWDDHD